MGDNNVGECVRGGEVAGGRLGSDSPEALVCGGSHELSEMETKITKPHDTASTGSLSPAGSFRSTGTPTKSPTASPSKSLGTPAKVSLTPPSSPVAEAGSPKICPPSSPVAVPRTTTSSSISPASHHSPSRPKTPTLSISGSPRAPSPSIPAPASPQLQNTSEDQKSPQHHHQQRSEPAGGRTSSPSGLSQNGRDPARPPLPSSGDGVNSSQDSPLPDISDIQPRFAKFLENTNKSKYTV